MHGGGGVSVGVCRLGVCGGGGVYRYLCVKIYFQ